MAMTGTMKIERVQNGTIRAMSQACDLFKKFMSSECVENLLFAIWDEFPNKAIFLSDGFPESGVS